MPEKQSSPRVDALFVAQILTASVAALLVLARAPDAAIVATAALSLACVALVPPATYRVAAIHGPPDDQDRRRTLGHRGPWALSRRLLVVAWLAGSTTATTLAELLVPFPAAAPSDGAVLVATGQPVGLLSTGVAIVLVETLSRPPERHPSTTLRRSPPR